MVRWKWEQEPELHRQDPAVFIFLCLICMVGFLGGSDGKESACNAVDLGLIPGSGRSPEEEIAAHSSILAWRIPGTEGCGGLQSMGPQRVRHD